MDVRARRVRRWVVVENQYGARREATTTVTVRACDEEPPQPSIEVVTDDPVVGEPVTLAGSVENRADDAVTYRWAFGDGQTETAETTVTVDCE